MKKQAKKFANVLKSNLFALIGRMAKSPEPYVKNPGKDFTRNRKLPFETVVSLLIHMGGASIRKELMDATECDIETATTSAFVQARDKLKHETFEFVLGEMNESLPNPQTYCGYRLFAVDGSDLHIAADPEDADTYFQNNEGEKGYSLLHLNALYDLENRIYVDALVQKRRNSNESKALCDMVDRSAIKDPVIVVGDRAFESYNNFAHIEQKGWNYVIRVKDMASTGICAGLKLPDTEEFDVQIERILTRKQTKEVKANRQLYKFLPSNSNFDFMDKTNPFYAISFRVTRIKLENNSYETLITNLDKSSFTADALKEIYTKRWGIETSFRKLKHTVGLENFHAKKREYIIQEIFSRMIMYNFTEMVTSHVIISQNKRKHRYIANFTMAVYYCKKLLRQAADALPLMVEALIAKDILPIREGKHNPRKIRPKQAVWFSYRVA